MNTTELIDNKSALVQLMAWCRQATSLTWANVDPDLCRYIAPPCLYELSHRQEGVLFSYKKQYWINQMSQAQFILYERG